MLSKSIVCFDLDGTITSEEILPKLSKELGLYNEISALTDATIKGVIPFKQSFLLRCRLLQTIPIKKVHEIIDNVVLNEEIVSFINEHSSRCKVVTGNLDVWIKPLMKRINCEFYTSKATEVDGRLGDILTVIEKAEVIESFKNTRVISVGDGMGDVGMFEKSNVKIAFGKVHDPIASLIEVSDYLCFNELTLCKILNTQLSVLQD